MADKLTAADAIRRLAVQFEAMVQAADVLEQIGAPEVAIADVQKKHQQAVADLEAVKRDIRQANVELAHVQQQAIDVGGKAAEDAAILKHDAKVQADALLAAARTDVDRLMTHAEADRTAELADLVKKIAQAKAALTELTNQAGTKQQAITALETQRQVAQAALDKVLAQIKQLQGVA